jgi:hypothetical protein
MLVSSTSMKVAMETITAMSQGLCDPAAERGKDGEDSLNFRWLRG